MSGGIGQQFWGVAQERRAQAPPLGHVVSWGLFGSVAYAGCQWGMLVALAKLGNAEMLGQFALGFAVSAPVFLLTNLSLRAVLATDARGEHAFGDYFALRLLTTVAGLLVIAAVASLVGYRWETKAVILLVGVVKAIESVSDVLYGLMQKRERMDLIATSVVLRGAISLFALAAGVYISGSVLWGLVVVSAVWAVVLLTHDLPASTRLLKAEVRPRWVYADLARLTRLSLPLGVTAMLISLSITIPRYFLERYRGEQELGAFVAMAYLMVIGSTVVNALGQSMSPRLAMYYAAGDGVSFRRLSIGLIGLGGLLGGAGVVVALVWGRAVLTVLYRPEYAEHADTFALIMVAAGIGYVASFLYYTMTSARFFRVQMPLFGGVAAVTLVACAALIPGNGLVGAGQASVATSLADLLGVGVVHLYAMRHLKTTMGGGQPDTQESEK